jgi:hypothetical protein
MADFPGQWWVGGGWAIDLWLGRQTRDHEDIEICIYRHDQAAIAAACSDWQLLTPIDDAWAPIAHGTQLDPPQFMLQLQQTPTTVTTVPNMPPTFEFLLNDRDGDVWFQPDEPEVRLPAGQVYGVTPLGVPAAVPELVLLHKAWTVERAKDDHDFHRLRGQLRDDQRAWLARHITRTRPDHRWLPLLTAEPGLR